MRSGIISSRAENPGWEVLHENERTLQHPFIPTLIFSPMCYRWVTTLQCSSVYMEGVAKHCPLSLRHPTSTPGSRPQQGECVHSAGRRSVCCSPVGTLGCAVRTLGVGCAASIQDCQKWPSCFSRCCCWWCLSAVHVQNALDAWCAMDKTGEGDCQERPRIQKRRQHGSMLMVWLSAILTGQQMSQGQEWRLHQLIHACPQN